MSRESAMWWSVAALVTATMISVAQHKSMALKLNEARLQVLRDCTFDAQTVVAERVFNCSVEPVGNQPHPNKMEGASL